MSEKSIFNKVQELIKLQEIDMKMLRLIELKKERKEELKNISLLKKDLFKQKEKKKSEVEEIHRMISSYEGEEKSLRSRIKELEAKQESLKKVKEFNAIMHEVTTAERESSQIKQLIIKLTDEKSEHESILKHIEENLKITTENYSGIEKEIIEMITAINKEGNQLKEKRYQLVENIDEKFLSIYEALLEKKKDRVIVPMENRACSGCNIILTSHYESLLRRRERLVFCEHCSRILYWVKEADVSTEAGTVVKRRRRKKAVQVSS